MPNGKKGTRGGTTSPPQVSEIVQSLDSETITVEGRRISMREAHLTLLYRRSLKGDILASVELQRIRARCGAETSPQKVGVLVAPEPMGLDEFAELAFKQQAQFRERNYGSDAS